MDKNSDSDTSVEGVLASIRKILSDEELTKKDTILQADDDIVDLTKIVNDDGTVTDLSSVEQNKNDETNKLFSKPASDTVAKDAAPEIKTQTNLHEIDTNAQTINDVMKNTSSDNQHETVSDASTVHKQNTRHSSNVYNNTSIDEKFAPPTPSQEKHFIGQRAFKTSIRGIDPHVGHAQNFLHEAVSKNSQKFNKPKIDELFTDKFVNLIYEILNQAIEASLTEKLDAVYAELAMDERIRQVAINYAQDHIENLVKNFLDHPDIETIFQEAITTELVGVLQNNQIKNVIYEFLEHWSENNLKPMVESVLSVEIKKWIERLKNV